MLTVKPSARRVRAVLTGPEAAPTGAAMVTDDRLRIVRVEFDLRNKTAKVVLAYGAMIDGAFSESGETLQVTMDRSEGRPNPLHDKTWQYLRQLMQQNSGELSMALLEQVIVDRRLLDEVQT